MVQRVAVANISHGEGDKRVEIAAGERFDTDSIGLSEEDVKRMDENGVLREPRDETGRAETSAGPGEEPVTEGRSGPASNVTSGSGPTRPRRGATDEL